MKNLVFITGAITFADLDAGRVSNIEVLKQQVHNWLLAPAKHLAAMEPVIGRQYEHGMSLFALELMFFEPHGQYLSGTDSTGKAGQAFSIGFDRFRSWLQDNNRIGKEFGADEAKKVRNWARNGLFHSGQLKDGLLVDMRRSEKYAFYKNPAWEGWLVDPWNLLNDIEQYFVSYIHALTSASHPEHCSLKSAFEKTFQRLVVAPNATRI